MKTMKITYEVPDGHRKRHGSFHVPWSLVAPHDNQARLNHDQSLERLNERGGLDPIELYAIVHDLPWRKVFNTKSYTDCLQWAMIFRTDAV